jgi:hypothetical protein
MTAREHLIPHGAAILFIVMCAMNAAVYAQNPQPPCGTITGLEGEIVICRLGTGPSRAELGFELFYGDTVVAAMGSRCSGVTPEGENFQLAGPGKLILKAVHPERGQLLAGLLDKVRAPLFDQLVDYIGDEVIKPLVTRGGVDTENWKYETEICAPIVPAAAGAVRATRPRFIWTTVNGAKEYEIIVRAPDGREIRETVIGNETVLEGLADGKSYDWRALPLSARNCGEAVWHPFHVMTLEQERELDTYLSRLPCLEAGWLLYEAGLYAEALDKLDTAAQNSETRRSALSWRALTLAAMGLHREAFCDYLAAQK